MSASFQLESPEFRDGDTLPLPSVHNVMGATGENISPELAWRNAPAGTKSLALTMYDPDAPTGSGWWHWVVYNLPANVTELPEGAGAAGNANLPAGAAQGRTDFGTTAFGGACPPVGDAPHRYVFTVHALKVEKLELPADATAALIGYMLHANGLGKASFTALYGR